MSSVASAKYVIETGAEPIMHMSTRDRNRIAIESELYGAYALGIRNILFISGDHTVFGSHPEAKMVYDIDTIQALQLASHLMTGTDLAGDSLDGIPEFLLGSTFNPSADPLELQAMRVEKKRDAGARFFQTQAIFDIERLELFMDSVKQLGIKVLAGIVPLKSPEMAQFLNRYVPGIKIPENLIQRLEEAAHDLKEEDRQNAMSEEGLCIASETISKIRKIKGIHGIHIMGIGWEESIPELTKRAKLYPRPKAV